MHTNFFCTNFLNTPRGLGHPSKIPGTSQIPLFETQGRQTFERGHELFDPHHFGWKTPSPPGGLRTKKVNLYALYSCPKSTPLSSPPPVPYGAKFYTPPPPPPLKIAGVLRSKGCFCISHYVFPYFKLFFVTFFIKK